MGTTSLREQLNASFTGHSLQAFWERRGSTGHRRFAWRTEWHRDHGEVGLLSTPTRLTIEDLAHLDDRSLQIVLRQIDHPTLVYALRGASPAIVDTVFRNVSLRARARLREDIDAAVGELLPERVAAARQVIGDVLTTLYAREAIREHDTGAPRPSLLAESAVQPIVALVPPPPPPPAPPEVREVPAPPPPPAPLDVQVVPVAPPPPAPPEAREVPASPLLAPPSDVRPVGTARFRMPRPPQPSAAWVRDPAAVAARLAEYGMIVRRKGPLALDPAEARIDVTHSLGRHLRLGLQLVVDREDAEQAQELLAANTELESATLAAALDLLTEGILAIQTRIAPRALTETFSADLTPADMARLARVTDVSASGISLEDAVYAIAAMAAWCRDANRGGFVALEPAANALNVELDAGDHARIGLMLVVDGQEAEIVRDVLDTNRDTVVAALHQAAEMVDAGIWYIQNEHPSGAVADGLSVFLAPHDRARFRALCDGAMIS